MGCFNAFGVLSFSSQTDIGGRGGEAVLGILNKEIVSRRAHGRKQYRLRACFEKQISGRSVRFQSSNETLCGVARMYNHGRTLFIILHVARGGMGKCVRDLQR